MGRGGQTPAATDPASILYGDTPLRSLNEKITETELANGTKEYYDHTGSLCKLVLPRGARCDQVVPSCAPDRIPGAARVLYIEDGHLHRLDGPAVEYTEEKSVEYWVNGQLHRPDGPAIVCEDGLSQWYVHGQKHRIDGPAYQREDGRRYWYRHGQLHREDGPAVTDDLPKIKKQFQDGYYLCGERCKNKRDWKKKLRELNG